MAIESVIGTALKIASGGLTGVIFDSTVELIRAGTKDTMGESLAKLREDTERQKMAMEMAQAQARVAQELAIARRIEGAADVQIEEYYEYSGDGSLGLKTDGNGLTIGASGSGQRVSKRIYRFTGGQSPVTGISAEGVVISEPIARVTAKKKRS